MYKIMIYINTYSGDKWFYYQENEKDYVARSLHEIKETVLTLIDTYGKDNIKIVKQVTGEDMEGSVETFIYDSTDNYEELVNRPSINGVEIIGELSLAELGIQPAGDYAENAKVSELEQAISNIDFSSYATNERVDQVEYKVDNIDLTSYATNERVDQVEDRIDNIDVTAFYTKEETDAKDNERLRGYFWDYSGNSLTIGSNLERISETRYGNIFIELSKLWDQIAVGGMHPIEVEDSNGYRAWLMPNGTAGGSFYIIYKYRGQVILNTPSSAADADLYRSYYLEFRVNRDDNKLWEADFVCKEGFEQPSMARVEAYVQEQIDGINFSASDENITGIKTFSVLPRSTVMPVTEDELTNKSYVDHGVENCASKEYVDTAISNIEIPEVNLDGYATTEYVDNAIADIDIPEETTETVIFTSSETKEQRKEKYFHLLSLYNSGKKFNAFFRCDQGVSVLGSSLKPDMPKFGFLYDISFARGGSYNYKYSMTFLVMAANGNMQSVGDGFAKIEMFSQSSDPTQTYIEQCTCYDTENNYYLPRKKELITQSYVENYGIKTISGSIPFTNLDPGASTWATYYTKTETTITGVPTLGTHTIPAGKVVFVGHYNTEPMTTAGGLWYWTTVGTAKGFGIANGIGSLTDYTTLAYSSTPTIKKQWTFDVIPKTEVEPTNDTHLVNKKYVDDAIASIEIPETGGSDIDLSNILTKDNTEEFTPDGDYEPATKKYVDDENKGLVILEKLNFGAQAGNGYGITDEVILNKILNGMLKGGNYYPAFLGVGVSGKQVLFTFVSSYTSNQYKSFTYMGTTTLGEKTNTSEVHKLTFTINGMGYMSSDTKTISNVNTSFSHINRSLNTDNTISYTPTADYHPSTKKYVDDAIAAAITTVLGGEY